MFTLFRRSLVYVLLIIAGYQLWHGQSAFETLVFAYLIDISCDLARLREANE